MNIRHTLTTLTLCGAAFLTNAQYTSKPPEVSPAPMKPEMTEIWEPEVRVVTPAKVVGDAPSDAIILFNGKNLDQWVSQKDATKPAPWKIVNNDHMEVVPGSAIASCTLSLARLMLWKVKGKAVVTAECFFKTGTSFKFWIRTITERIATGRQPVFIKTMHPWLTQCAVRWNGIVTM